MNIKKQLLKKFSKLFIAEALENAKRRLTALATCLKKYSREVEVRRINSISSNNPSKIYSHWQGSKVDETEVHC